MMVNLTAKGCLGKAEVKALTVEQAEADNSGESLVIRCRFGVQESEWVRLVSKIEPGTKLYAYT